MRHRVKGRKFGRKREQREALFRSLVRALVVEGEILTTEARAKTLRGYVDRLVRKAQEASPVTLERSLAQEHAAEIITGLKTIAKNLAGRISGFTTIVKAPPRKSDAASMAIVKFVGK